MEIEVRLDTNRAVVVLRGDLTTGEPLRLLREKVDGLLRDGYRDVVIDLESMGYVDSAGLDELVEVYSRIQGFGAIRLVGLPGRQD